MCVTVFAFFTYLLRVLLATYLQTYYGRLSESRSTSLVCYLPYRGDQAQQGGETSGQ